jgi:hypothetical protein
MFSLYEPNYGSLPPELQVKKTAGALDLRLMVLAVNRE